MSHFKFTYKFHNLLIIILFFIFPYMVIFRSIKCQSNLVFLSKSFFRIIILFKIVVLLKQIFKLIKNVILIETNNGKIIITIFGNIPHIFQVKLDNYSKFLQ
jgi:hypothetical protein